MTAIFHYPKKGYVHNYQCKKDRNSSILFEFQINIFAENILKYINIAFYSIKAF